MIENRRWGLTSGFRSPMKARYLQTSPPGKNGGQMHNWTRREFLAASAFAAAQAESPNTAGVPGITTVSRGDEPKAAPKSVAATDKIVLGFIGVGGMGTGLLNEFQQVPGRRNSGRVRRVRAAPAPRPRRSWRKGRNLR